MSEESDWEERVRVERVRGESEEEGVKEER